ncbi:hypothetical protein TUM12370_13410 [Salmonella enterica subsp. enterica serovar Choleraesuis]|nr:hypothetical protein TUM12370_13410 [Salmonella enterica subsp. enterica serovar Choleraesuis]
MQILETMADRGLLHACTVNEEGQLLYVSSSLAELTGDGVAALPHAGIERIFSTESTLLLRRLFANPPPDDRLPQLELTLIHRTSGLYSMLASGLFERSDTAPAMIHLALIALGPLSQRINELQNANEIMSQMLYSARVAYWCIEWLEPVDVTGTCDEVVRQVFENRSHWRMCNRAMMEVYEMPADVVFTQQPVRLYWPRSPANEEFVRRLVETDFCVDGALSVDRRHDGSPAYVENDVRASIQNGRLLRMWGSIRDVSQELRIQHDADQRIDALRRVFDAVPDAVVVIDELHQPQWRNAAFERTFGITHGTGIAHALLDASLPERAWHNLLLPDVSGQIQPYNIHCSRILMQESVAWKVAVLRAAKPVARHSSELHP